LFEIEASRSKIQHILSRYPSSILRRHKVQIATEKKASRFATTGFSILVATDQLPFGSTLEISETFSIGSEAFE
jgi:hypothetical protein